MIEANASTNIDGKRYVLHHWFKVFDVGLLWTVSNWFTDNYGSCYVCAGPGAPPLVFMCKTLETQPALIYPNKHRDGHSTGNHWTVVIADQDIAIHFKLAFDHE